MVVRDPIHRLKLRGPECVHSVTSGQKIGVEARDRDCADEEQHDDPSDHPILPGTQQRGKKPHGSSRCKDRQGHRRWRFGMPRRQQQACDKKGWPEILLPKQY
jgi:hypothetical protein